MYKYLHLFSKDVRSLFHAILKPLKHFDVFVPELYSFGEMQQQAMTYDKKFTIKKKIQIMIEDGVFYYNCLEASLSLTLCSETSPPVTSVSFS